MVRKEWLLDRDIFQSSLDRFVCSAVPAGLGLEITA